MVYHQHLHFYQQIIWFQTRVMICQLFKPAVLYFSWMTVLYITTHYTEKANGDAMKLTPRGSGVTHQPIRVLYLPLWQWLLTYTITHRNDIHTLQHSITLAVLSITVFWHKHYPSIFPGSFSQYILVPYLPTWVAMHWPGYLVQVLLATLNLQLQDSQSPCVIFWLSLTMWGSE